MAKKKSKNNAKSIALYVALIFGVLATAMIFLPSVVGAGNVFGSEVSYTGLQTAFGYKESAEVFGGSTVTTEILKMNVFSLLAYALPLASIVVGLLFRNSKLFSFISAGGFIASGVFAFLSITTFPATVIGSEIASGLYTYSLGIGAILSGAFSIIAGLAGLYRTLKK
jgi:hypothetical protein